MKKGGLFGDEEQVVVRRPLWPRLLPKTVSGFGVLLQLGSVSVSVTQATPKGQVDICTLADLRGLHCYLKPC